jgi:hypothetical protein
VSQSGQRKIKTKVTALEHSFESKYSTASLYLPLVAPVLMPLAACLASDDVLGTTGMLLNVSHVERAWRFRFGFGFGFGFEFGTGLRGFGFRFGFGSVSASVSASVSSMGSG